MGWIQIEDSASPALAARLGSNTLETDRPGPAMETLALARRTAV